MKSKLLIALLILGINLGQSLQVQAYEEIALKNPYGYQISNNDSYKPILKGNVHEDSASEIPLTGIGVIGLRFIHRAGYPSFIEEVYSNSPARQSGLRASDLIYAINGVKTSKLTTDEVYQLISGAPGTKVRITIQRGQSMFNVEIERQDLANFPNDIQNRYLMGPIVMPSYFAGR